MIGVSETTANIYIRIVGEKGETGTVMMQNKTTLEVEFSTQNLGRLVTLTIGHDNSGMFPSWVRIRDQHIVIDLLFRKLKMFWFEMR